jgi:hypothetical protein
LHNMPFRFKVKAQPLRQMRFVLNDQNLAHVR